MSELWERKSREIGEAQQDGSGYRSKSGALAQWPMAVSRERDLAWLCNYAKIGDGNSGRARPPSYAELENWKLSA